MADLNDSVKNWNSNELSQLSRKFVIIGAAIRVWSDVCWSKKLVLNGLSEIN